MVRRKSSRYLRRATWACCILPLVTCEGARTAPPQQLPKALAAISAVRMPRTIAARLSVDERFESCREEQRAGQVVATTTCDLSTADVESQRLQTAKAIGRARVDF